jgi:hypothetical protein
MKNWNREEQAIVSDYQAGKIKERAAECARRNEQGFKHNWTVEQHESALIAKAESLLAAATAETMAKTNSSKNGRATFANYRDADKALAQFGFGE